MVNKVDLILVHGLLGSIDFFKPNDLLPGINVRSPDLHGYGNSPLKKNLSLQDQVDFLKEFIEETTNEPCWLLAHSVGGAIVNIFASQHPQLVNGIINVEGNFTIKDAFWCQSISEKDPKTWEAEYAQISNDPEKWLTDSQISLSSQRISWAKNILAYQDATTVQAVAKAVVRSTNTPEYLSVVTQVIGSNTPVYLVAGERSVKDWDVPTYVKESAVELYIFDESGHMMMLEKPEAFCQLIERIIVSH